MKGGGREGGSEGGMEGGREGGRERADICFNNIILFPSFCLFLRTSPRRYSGVLVATKPFASVCEREGGWNRNTPNPLPLPTPANLPQKLTPPGGFVPGSVTGKPLVMVLLTVAVMMMMMMQILWTGGVKRSTVMRRSTACW